MLWSQNSPGEDVKIYNDRSPDTILKPSEDDDDSECFVEIGSNLTVEAEKETEKVPFWPDDWKTIERIECYDVMSNHASEMIHLFKIDFVSVWEIENVHYL